MRIEDRIRNNCGLVYRQLHRFHLSNDNDAESLAFEALWKASVDYDKTKGTRFSTLATVYIYNSLCGYLRKLKAKNKLDFVSCNAKLGDDEHELIDLIAAIDTTDEDSAYEELCTNVVILYNELLEDVHNEKHRTILEIWRTAGFNCSATYIASKVGVSQSYVSQVLNVFKHNVKIEMESRYGISC